MCAGCQRRAVFLRNRQQRDFAFKRNELFDDDFGLIAATFGDAVLPRFLDVVSGFDRALTFAAGTHQRLHHARNADALNGFVEFFARRGVGVARGFDSQFFRREIANRFAVHGEIGGTRAGHDLNARRFIGVKPFSANGFDFRHDDVGFVSTHNAVERLAIEHIDDFVRVRDLHRRRARVRINRNNVLPQTLARDDEFLAQFSRTEKQNLFHGFTFYRF
jgi:hypothetical protein